MSQSGDAEHKHPHADGESPVGLLRRGAEKLDGCGDEKNRDDDGQHSDDARGEMVDEPAERAGEAKPLAQCHDHGDADEEEGDAVAAHARQPGRGIVRFGLLLLLRLLGRGGLLRLLLRGIVWNSGTHSGNTNPSPDRT